MTFEQYTFQSDPEARAERLVLGICMQYPLSIVDVPLEPSHFFDPRHQVTWQAIRALSDAGKGTDVTLVVNEIKRGGTNDIELPELYQHLLATFNEVVSGSNVSFYVEMVRNSWARRRVAMAAAEIIVAAKSAQHSGSELLDMLLTKVADIETGEPDDAVPMPKLVRDRFTQLMAMADAKGRGEEIRTGLPTGIKALDAMIGGLQPGIVTVIAGRPGMGKSAQGLTISDAVSALGKGVHVFSMEDIREAYVDRTISRHSGVPVEKLRAIDLKLRDMHEIGRAAGILFKRGTWLVDDRSGLTPEEIIRSVRRHRKANGTECVVIDYAQIVRGLPRQERYEVISRAMDLWGDAAKQDKLAYVVLAQLNRDCEKREDKRPLLADLKQSGSIEERSKCVLMLYRPRVYDDTAPEDEIEIIVRKNNQGATGTAYAKWSGPTTTISDRDPDGRLGDRGGDDGWR